ncbi:MAG: hypothetical protein ACK5IQ_02000 [Bacteroidales bacterium]
MKIVLADTGVLISLIHIGHLNLIEEVLGDFYVAGAVWKELKTYDNPNFDSSKLKNIESKVIKVSSKNYLSMIMDRGEAESEQEVFLKEDFR